MRVKTALILGAAALYFYGPRLTSRVAEKAGDALENLTDASDSSQSKSRRTKSGPKALPQPEQAEGSTNNAFGSGNSVASDNTLVSIETEGESFEERAAAAHMSRRAGKTGTRNGTDGI